MKPYWLSEHGFTLLEVVVAIVIITTLVATFGPLIASSVRNIKWSGLRMQALYSMRGVMERKLATFDGAPAAITIRGPNPAGKVREWQVEGALIAAEDLNQEGRLTEALVSFVVPKQ